MEPPAISAIVAVYAALIASAALVVSLLNFGKVTSALSVNAFSAVIGWVGAQEVREIRARFFEDLVAGKYDGPQIGESQLTPEITKLLVTYDRYAFVASQDGWLGRRLVEFQRDEILAIWATFGDAVKAYRLRTGRENYLSDLQKAYLRLTRRSRWFRGMSK